MEKDIECYVFEKNRLNSFKNWPFNEQSMCNKKTLAEAGFYWKGTDKDIDVAGCFLCDKVLDGWEATDDPWMEHRTHAPQCEFVRYSRKESELTLEEFLLMLKNYYKKIATQERSNIMKHHLIDFESDREQIDYQLKQKTGKK